LDPRTRATSPARSADEAAWRAARGFDDLCELGARFVAGELGLFPGWLASTTDVETDALAPALVRLNRAGLLTLASQPGLIGHAHDGAALAQRAFVTGMLRPDLAPRVLAHGSEAQIALHVRGGARAEPVAVATRGGVAYVFTGHNAFEEELVCFEDWLAPEALSALEHALYLTAYDPLFGRNDYLWSALESALRPRDP
jgi:hypothetical protein